MTGYLSCRKGSIFPCFIMPIAPCWHWANWKPGQIYILLKNIYMYCILEQLMGKHNHYAISPCWHWANWKPGEYTYIHLTKDFFIGKYLYSVKTVVWSLCWLYYLCCLNKIFWIELKLTKDFILKKQAISKNWPRNTH